jgi:hypothetical protein
MVSARVQQNHKLFQMFVSMKSISYQKKVNNERVTTHVAPAWAEFIMSRIEHQTPISLFFLSVYFDHMMGTPPTQKAQSLCWELVSFKNAVYAQKEQAGKSPKITSLSKFRV